MRYVFALVLYIHSLFGFRNLHTRNAIHISALLVLSSYVFDAGRCVIEVVFGEYQLSVVVTLYHIIFQYIGRRQFDSHFRYNLKCVSTAYAFNPNVVT